MEAKKFTNCNSKYLNVKFPDGCAHVRKSEFFETISLSVSRDDSEGATIAGRLGQISAYVNP
jgi:hypothetical protein